MSDQIVAYFRSLQLRLPASDYLAAGRALSERVAAMGGRLVAWGAAGCAYEFGSDAIEDAIECAIQAVQGSIEGQSYSVGVSEGRLEQAVEATTQTPIVWGPALVRAAALARAAKPGEVVVDSRLTAVRAGELSFTGDRMALVGKDRARGHLLELGHPWRRAPRDSSPALRSPDWVGAVRCGDLSVAAGHLALVRAAHGYGGSRFLDELERHLGAARILRVAPHPLGEPLGALRRALLRAIATGQAPPGVDGILGKSLDAVIGGAGLVTSSAGELLGTWLRPGDATASRGVVLVDDVEAVDADTLDAIASGLSAETTAFAVVLRLGESGGPPAAFSQCPVSGEMRLGVLSPEAAAALASSCTGGVLEPRAAARWGNRGGGVPLGIVEAVWEAVERGELVLRDGAVRARSNEAPDGTAHPARHWIKTRYRYLQSTARTLLEALAVLGGEAETRELQEVIEKRTDCVLDVEEARIGLERGGWLRRVKPDLLRVTSTTLRDAVLSTLDDTGFGAWHRAACDVIRQRPRPLAVASATAHAVLAGDAERATALAHRAAAAADDASLNETADAFARLAEDGELAQLLGRALFCSQLETARSIPTLWPMPAERTESTEVTRLSRPAAPAPTRRKPPLPPSARRGNGRSTSSNAPPRRNAFEALRSGDIDAVVRAADELSGEGGNPVLADRLRALVDLARGETGDALRRLREAADAAKRARSADQCRTALTLAVALGASNRKEDALLAALGALARARETADVRGEAACVRFLSALSGTAGDAEAARRWAALGTAAISASDER